MTRTRLQAVNYADNRRCCDTSMDGGSDYYRQKGDNRGWKHI